VALHQADYFSLGIEVYEEIAIDVILLRLIRDILNPCNSICSVVWAVG
jgi:hypothetical protein